MDYVLRELTQASSKATSGSEQQVQQTAGDTLSERRRYLQQQASNTSARTQGMVPVPDDILLPMKASDYGSEPHDMDDASEFVERVKVLNSALFYYYYFND